MTTTKNNEHKKLNFSSEREQSQACLNSAEHEKNQGRKVLNVPNLRFPEFQGEWEYFLINDVCSEFKSGKNIKADSVFECGEYPVYGGNGLRGYTSSYNHEGSYVLIGRQGALCGNVRSVYGKTYITEHAIAVAGNEKSNTNFLHYLFLKMNLGQYSDQSAQPGLAVNKLLKLKVALPIISEQTKIAKLLSLLDERIATQNKIIDKLQSLIKGIMVELQKQGVNKGTWKKVFLSDVLTERNERNTNLFQVFSVSVSQGVVNQVDYLGRSFAAKDTSKYNVVHYGDLVYTKSPTGSFPYGIVKQSLNLENVAVSPLYGVYKPKSLAVGAYLHEYFMSEINTHNYLHPLIQKGAKNTINITNQRFLENCVLLPTNINELLQISKLLRSLNNKIKYQQDILQQYQKQKQYLLRQMFI